MRSLCVFDNSTKVFRLRLGYYNSFAIFTEARVLILPPIFGRD